MNRLDKFIIKAGITAKAARVHARPSSDWANQYLDASKDFPCHAHFLVTLESDQTKEVFTTFYSMPIPYPYGAPRYALEKVRADFRLEKPCTTDVIQALIMDAQCVREVQDEWDFIEEFALGDGNSRDEVVRSIRQAHETYRSCRGADRMLHYLLGPTVYWKVIHLNEEELEEDCDATQSNQQSAG